MGFCNFYKKDVKSGDIRFMTLTVGGTMGYVCLVHALHQVP